MSVATTLLLGKELSLCLKEPEGRFRRYRKDFQVGVAVLDVNPVGTCACRELSAAVRGFEADAD